MGTKKKSDLLPFSHINEHLSIPCLKCEDFVHIKGIQDHRELHRVLKIFRCSMESMPKTMKQLVKRRRQIINDAIAKSDPNHPLPAKIMRKIDWAFEILKKQIILKETTENQTISAMPIFEKSCIEVSGFSRKLERIALALGVCQDQNSSWRAENEDRFVYEEGMLGKINYGYFGLFDGYSGSTAAEKCADYFHKFLTEEINQEYSCLNLDTGEIPEEQKHERERFVKLAINNAFYKMESFLLHGETEKSKNRWSGASATICYVEDDTLYVANVGNVHALYVKNDGTTMNLVEDHIPRNKKEQNRIKKANGSISSSYRLPLVNGLLSSTRGLGNHGDANLKSSVICKPNINVVQIDPDDQFVILFTAGISEVFNNDEVMFLLEDIMPDTSGIEDLRQHFELLAGSSVNNDDTQNGQTGSLPSTEHVRNSTIHPTSSNHETFTANSSSKLWCADTDNVASAMDSSKTDYDDPGFDTRNVAMLQARDKDGSEIEIDIQHDTQIDKQCNENITGQQDRPERTSKLYKENKACFLARALVERLSYAALLAGSRENLTAVAVLLNGCPVNLYLLPNIKRKSVVQREWLNG